MTFTVLYDANVLYPNVLRDVLIRLAQTGLVHARWTDRILDETFEKLAEDRPDIPASTLTKLRELMNCRRYRTAWSPATRPSSPHSRCRMRTTGMCWPRRSAPAPRSSSPRICGTSPTRIWQFGVEAKHPDEFVMDLFHLDGVRVHQAVSATAAAWRHPPGTPADVCDRLAAAALPISSAPIRAAWVRSVSVGPSPAGR
ncbi:conserved hypothetical protein (plasmid) [Rhodococcus jostii RHA1]|uniref:VapC50 C-terminal domain-containing protein n=1 Tax=Rhodococcus jostii (strain RHA1) TaxID=101510 RepID=Q0RVX2_RHOJR|nr:conserved hypothetical protein [Rhodococcus jostii RHA1]